MRNPARRLMAFVLVLSIGFGLAACSDNGERTAADQATPEGVDVSLGQIDSTLHGVDGLERVSADITEKGLVLTGTVSSDSLKQKAAAVVSAIDGVAQVDNEVLVGVGDLNPADRRGMVDTMNPPPDAISHPLHQD